MSIQGCDYAWARPAPDLLYGAGYRFACRYLSYDTTGKNLTDLERIALHRAGLDVVLNWEYGPRAAANGYAQGSQDASEALRQSMNLGAPPTAAIYFSVDYDAPVSDFPAIREYFRGCASVLGPSQVGAYGGYPVVNILLSSPYVRWLWQTYAWSGGQWCQSAHLRQTLNGVQFQGSDIDNDSAMVDHFGQWSAIGGTVTQPTPQDVATALLAAEVSGTGDYLGVKDVRQALKDGATLWTVVQRYADAHNTTPEQLLAALLALPSKVDELASSITQGGGPLTGSVAVSGTLSVSR